MKVFWLLGLVVWGTGVCWAGIATTKLEDPKYKSDPTTKPAAVTTVSTTTITTTVTSTTTVSTAVASNEASNEVGSQLDSYSMYRRLMDLRTEMLDKDQPESEVLKMVKSAFQVVYDTAYHSFKNGFLPSVERFRRDADDDKRSYLDGAVYLVGALLGKQKCTNMIACRCGKIIQTRIPGAQLAVMMAETIIPKTIQPWFRVLKKSVIDSRLDTCEIEYSCTLLDEEQNPQN